MRIYARKEVTGKWRIYEKVMQTHDEAPYRVEGGKFLDGGTGFKTEAQANKAIREHVIQTNGRKIGKYDKDFHPDLAYYLGKFFNVNLCDIAQLLRLHPHRVEDWRRRYPEFRAALKTGKEEYKTRAVKDSLLKRALGFKVVETKIRETKDGIFEEKTEKNILPDVTSCIFWLCNKMPEEFKHVQRHESEQHIVNEHKGEINLKNCTTEELKVIQKVIEKNREVKAPTRFVQ